MFVCLSVCVCFQVTVLRSLIFWYYYKIQCHITSLLYSYVIMQLSHHIGILICYHVTVPLHCYLTVLLFYGSYLMILF